MWWSLSSVVVLVLTFHRSWCRVLKVNLLHVPPAFSVHRVKLPQIEKVDLAPDSVRVALRPLTHDRAHRTDA